MNLSIKDACNNISEEVAQNKALLDSLTSNILEAGLATWSGDKKDGTLIVSGHSKLLKDIHAMADLERIRDLFNALETTELMLKVLEMTEKGEGVQIFIGADNDLFSLSGCSFIVSPYRLKKSQLVGAIGVIGPARINYARIIPMVDYTAKLLGRVLG